MTAMRWILLLLLIVGGCSTSHPVATQPSLPVDAKAADSFFTPTGPGPTQLSKVLGGYQLLNRLYRVVISEQTGDVIFWSTDTESRNMLFHRGIYTTLTGLPDAPPHGYIEKRDPQTWQFFGEDDNHITWRKIYCLSGEAMQVSIMIQNHRADSLTTAIQINGDLPSLRIQHHDPEQFTGIGGYGTVSLQGFNEFHSPTSQPALPTLLQSDTFHLKPTEWQSYTSQWILAP
jgi:hypothetical protein